MTSRHVEPKIAARRVAVARDEGRRRLRALAALCVMTLTALAGIVVVNSPVLDVDEIVVRGATNTTQADIAAASGILLGHPLLYVDVAGAEERIGRLPWVESVALARSAGGTLTVTVTERVASAALPAVGGFALIDADARQLAIVTDPPPGFLPVTGIIADGIPGQPAPPETHSVLRLFSQLTPEIAGQVTSVIWGEGALSVTLAGGGRALLGDDTALEQKLLSLETVMARVDLRCLAEIDVRVPSAPAVTRMNANGDPRAPVVDLAECT
ncbi:MAG: FtsQ-type POTRA domain-containing protein [Actinomycetota bacterium]|nr:FtsQ-type POTRA domain-containing protein [Actinomycetota bacterium]